MRIGCLQFAPQVGDVDNNLNRADAVLSRADPEDLDLLVLPELAFSGYNFKSLEQIAPFLEPSGSGISSLWARTTALKYNCTVAVGYPEKVDPTAQWPTSPEYYNSVIAVNGDGETVANYRKTHLYYTDETWALEGDDGFFEGYIPGLGDTSMGICMDLNPYKFEAPWTAFEFAFHVLECQSNLVIVSMAWMTREDGRMFSRMPNEPDMDTMTYWVTRLEPLIRAENQEELIVVFCNRTGTEGDAVYAGTSAVIGIQDGEVKVYGVLGRGEKELLVVDTKDAPYAKLIYRPESSTSAAHGELQKATPASTSEASQRPPWEGGRGSRAQESAPFKKPPTPTVDSTGPSRDTATRKDRQRPQISIPSQTSGSGNNNSAMTAHSTGSDIPTPSAPSPTPNALRPKLVIPQSPPSSIVQAGSAVPMSAQSSYSVHSVHSVASNASIKSNERAPEDSTPYPHSGMPLSGYPRKKILGGIVTISHGSTFTPITPFEDASPVATRQYWPGTTVGLTPVDTAPQNGFGVSPSRRRRAFQDWPQIKPRHEMPAEQPIQLTSSPHLPLRQPAQNHVQPAAHQQFGRGSAQAVAAVGPHAQHISKRTGTPRLMEKDPAQPDPPKKSPRSIPLPDEPNPKESESTATEASTHHPARPSSPKSRNASRTGNRDRSDSSMGQHDQSLDIEQLLESITQRAESVNRNRAAEDGSPFPSRATPANPRPSSRSRGNDTGSSIMIGAAHSIFNADVARNSPRSMSRMGQHNRSSSTSGPQQVAERSQTPLGGEQNSNNATSRGVSRGRRPGPHVAFSAQGQFDSPSDSPGSGRQSRERPRRTSATGRTSQSRNAEFEVIESVVCPNCPVHSRPSNDSPRNPVLTNSTPAQPSPSGAGPRPSPPKIDQGFERSDSLDSRVSGLDSQAETLDHTGGTPSTPEFDLRTPKAMVFFRDSDDLIDMNDAPVSISPRNKNYTRVDLQEEIIL